MNAYELADELQKHGLNGDNYGLFNKRIQNMLRQQADRIADLEKQVEHYKNKAEALDKRELELLAEIDKLEKINVDISFKAAYAEKTLHIIERHYDQLDTQLHPQTKQSEPVAWIPKGMTLAKPKDLTDCIPLYTTPQTKPLSDEEIPSLLSAQVWRELPIEIKTHLVRKIEERHGIK